VLLVGSCGFAWAASSPVTGGTVPSTLMLSLGEPSDFKRTRSAHGQNVYVATIRAAVTATDAPVQLSVSGGGSASIDGPLRSWSEPVTHGTAKIRLRETAPSARALRGKPKLVVVTLTAGGP
jgi:hypothetical protein